MCFNVITVSTTQVQPVMPQAQSHIFLVILVMIEGNELLPIISHLGYHTKRFSWKYYLVYCKEHSGYIINYLFVSGVFGQSLNVSYSQNSICALEGSLVKMSCVYTYPSNLQVQVNWTKSSNREVFSVTQYKDRFQVQCQYEFGTCSLHIQSVKYSDSGNFYCKITTKELEESLIGDPGVHVNISGYVTLFH